MDRYNSEGTRVATSQELKKYYPDFVPCKAQGCKSWFNGRNVAQKGYCHDHTPPRGNPK